MTTDLDAATVKVEGQTVTFTLLGVELVTYSVTAPRRREAVRLLWGPPGFAETGGNYRRGLVCPGWPGADGHTHTSAHRHTGAHHHAETHGHARPDADPRSAAHVDGGGVAVGDAHALAHGNGGTRHARGNRCSGGSRR